MTAKFWIILAFAAGLMLMRPASAYDGQVVDAVTGAGIAGATIVAGARAIDTDAIGHFHLDAVAPPVFARAPGYRAGSFDPARVRGAVQLVPFTPKALYLTVYGIGSNPLRDAALALIKAGGANALVIDIKGDRGLLPYPSTVPLANQDGARRFTTIPNLAALVQDLHHRGIYLIARIVTFKDQPLATSRPDLAVKLAGGALYRDREGLAWTDPFQPEVQNYNIAIAVEAARAGFDEIQFDYVRFPGEMLDLKYAEPATEAARVAAIDGFLANARRQLLPYNVYLSADIFGYVCWNLNDTGIGQKLEQIAPEVDYLSPMLYPSTFQFGIPGIRDPVANSYQIVHGSLENALIRLRISPKRFRPWLQSFKDYAFDHRAFAAVEVAKQIKAAADFGSDGWNLWNPRNGYDADRLVPVKSAP